jgi:sulfate adenylyltransferase subunit 1
LTLSDCTDKRKFIIADTPGHEQYTRNMATGASTCNLAVILIDARHGVLAQTRRHSYIASLLGIRHVLVAINKMDLVDFDQKRFEAIREDYLQFAKRLEPADIRFVPISALDGDNVVNLSERTPWYRGQPVMEILESIEIAADKNFDNFRFPVQYVNRPHLDFRSFCGTVGAGVVRPGDRVTAMPSRKSSTVERIVTWDGDLPEAFNGQAVTLTLADEIDISRGDVIVHADEPVEVTNHFKAHLIWMAERELTPGREYLIKFATKTTPGRVDVIHHRIDVNTQELSDAESLGLNDIAVVDVVLNQHTVIDPYKNNQSAGAFIVIDRLTNITVGAGMVTQPLSAAEDDRVFEGRTEVEVALHGLLQRDLAPEEFERELKALVKAHYPEWGLK